MFEGLAENLPDYMPFLHGFTYNNHPVSCAAGLEALAIIEEEKLVENAGRVGEYLKARLQRLYDHRSVGDIRAIGLMAAVEVVRNKETKELIGELPQQAPQHIEALLWDKGVYTRAIPTESIAVAPPFIFTKEEVDTCRCPRRVDYDKRRRSFCERVTARAKKSMTWPPS